MTLKEKYEKCLQDSENFITGEKNNASCSYKYGKRLAQFFNEELDYSDMNIHYGYPIGGIRKEDWNLKIRFQLRGKGISDEVITEALGEVDTVKAAAKLDKLAAERYRLLKGDPQCRLKLLKALLSRGYGYDEVEGAVRRVMDTNE